MSEELLNFQVIKGQIFSFDNKYLGEVYGCEDSIHYPNRSYAYLRFEKNILEISTVPGPSHSHPSNIIETTIPLQERAVKV